MHRTDEPVDRQYRCGAKKFSEPKTGTGHRSQKKRRRNHVFSTSLVTFNHTVCLGSQGPKGAIGPLKKVASLRETARLVNQKIAQSLQKVCQKLTKSLPKYKKQQTQWGARSAPHSDRCVYYFGKLLVNFWQTFGKLWAIFWLTNLAVSRSEATFLRGPMAPLGPWDPKQTVWLNVTRVVDQKSKSSRKGSP